MSMQLIIEDLEWQLDSADSYIDTCEKRVATKTKRMMDLEKEVAWAVKELARSVNRKVELQRALEVLRNHESQELT